jgi:hypothetical protein
MVVIPVNRLTATELRAKQNAPHFRGGASGNNQKRAIYRMRSRVPRPSQAGQQQLQHTTNWRFITTNMKNESSKVKMRRESF